MNLLALLGEGTGDQLAIGHVSPRHNLGQGPVVLGQQRDKLKRLGVPAEGRRVRECAEDGALDLEHDANHAQQLKGDGKEVGVARGGVGAAEKVDRVHVASQHRERLGNLVHAAQLEGAEALGLVGVLADARGAKGGGRQAEAELLDVVVGDDAVGLEPGRALLGKGKHQAQGVDGRARHDEAVALGEVAVVGAVHDLPVDAQHGHHLDQVGNRCCGVGLGDVVGNRVPRLLLALDAHDEVVAGKRLGRPGHGALPFGVRGRVVVLEGLFLPLSRVVLHALDGHQHAEPGGGFIVSRVDAGAGGVALLAELAVELGCALGARVIIALLAAVEDDNLLLGRVAHGAVLVAGAGDKDHGHLELDLEAKLVPNEDAVAELGPFSDHLGSAR